jgi:Phycobilisome protein
MEELINKNFKKVDIERKSANQTLALEWGKKYLHNLDSIFPRDDTNDVKNIKELISSTGREKTREKLMASLRLVSIQAWNQVEILLIKEVERYDINPQLIEPWEIISDCYKIYEKALNIYHQQAPLRQLSIIMRLAREGEPLYQKALDIYTEQLIPSQLAAVIGSQVGTLRKKYTKVDSRIIAFVSMQFYYTSKMLLQMLSPLERPIVESYFRVIDDHLYMPLERAYEAASQHDYNSQALGAVQQLLPASTEIAKKITQRITELYPNYRSHTGILSEPAIQAASIRDVEMFQIYLWLAVLEGDVSAIQQELFPLCVMIYPTLKVEWELIRQMLYLLGQEICDRLTHEHIEIVMPYYQVLWHMFSPQLFGELGIEKSLKTSENNDFVK